MTEATAAVVRQPGGDFSIETIEVEAPREGEVRVRIAGVGLCHTDLIFRDQFAPFALPGVLGIEIVRHYNSAQAGTDAPLGLLGRGWRLSYETDLYVTGAQLHIVQADGTCSSGSGSTAAVRPDTVSVSDGLMP